MSSRMLSQRKDALFIQLPTELNEKAVAFAQRYGISKVYDNIDDVFYDPDVDIITSPLHTILTSII